MPGAPPRCDTPPTAPSPSTRITVQPVGRSVSVWWPTLMPWTSVRPFGACALRQTADENERASAAAVMKANERAIDAHMGRLVRTVSCQLVS